MAKSIYYYIKVDTDDEAIAEGLIQSLNMEVLKIRDCVWCTENEEEAYAAVHYLIDSRIPISTVAVEGDLMDDLGLCKN